MGVNRGCYWPCSGLIAEAFSKRLISGIDRNGDAKTLGASKFSKLEGVDTDNSSDLINQRSATIAWEDLNIRHDEIILHS